MAITDKEEGVWELEEVYNKQNQGGIWSYNAVDPYRLFAWGQNDDQNLGLNDRTNRSSPTQIPGTNWGGGKDMPYSNWFHSGSGSCVLSLKQDGTIWRWSEGKNGTSGANVPNYTWPSSPIQIGTDSDWYQLGGSPSNVVAVKSDGSLWSWGSNTKGQLGLNFAFVSPPNQQQRSSPCQIGTDTDWDTPIPTGTSERCMALKTDGTLWVWGETSGLNNNPLVRSSPTQIPGTTWTSGGTGSSPASRFVKSDGTLWTWGNNGRGELGLNQQAGYGSEGYSYSSPIQVGTDTTWKSNYQFGVSGGAQGALALKTDGTLWSWGYNNVGQLGQNQGPGNFSGSISSPTQIPGTNWDSVSMDGSSAFATKTDGTMWVWGRNLYGSLGLNQSSNPAPNFANQKKYSSPTQLPGTDWSVVLANKHRQVYGLKEGT